MWRVLTIRADNYNVVETDFPGDPVGVAQDEAWTYFFSKENDKAYLCVAILNTHLGDGESWDVYRAVTPALRILFTGQKVPG